MIKLNIIKQNLNFIKKTWIKCIGTFATILSTFFLFWTWENIGVTETSIKCIIIILLCFIAFIASIIWCCVLKKSKTIWEGPSGEIKVCYSDIIKESFDDKIKEETLFVIPVNSCFDTIVDEDISSCSKPLVSPNSLHGKWLNKMFDNNYDTKKIDEKIHNCLKNQQIKPKRELSKKEKKRGKRQEYNLGTVAMIRGEKKNTFLLLAIANFDKNNVAHTTADDLVTCIKSLIYFYEQYGQGHKLMVPLMGTNLSHAGLSHNDSLRIITSLFQLYGDKIHGEIDVIIYKGDKNKVSLDI